MVYTISDNGLGVKRNRVVNCTDEDQEIFEPNVSFLGNNELKVYSEAQHENIFMTKYFNRDNLAVISVKPSSADTGYKRDSNLPSSL